MKLFTKKEVLDNLLERYTKWIGDKHRTFRCGRNSADVIKQLSEEDNLTQERAQEIVGDTYSLELICDECGKDSSALIRLGEQPDYESRTASICQKCLANAQNKMPSKSGFSIFEQQNLIRCDNNPFLYLRIDDDCYSFFYRPFFSFCFTELNLDNGTVWEISYEGGFFNSPPKGFSIESSNGIPIMFNACDMGGMFKVTLKK